MKKQELQVAALENGTVIDHIPSERLFTVVSLLGLEHMSNNITIGFNLKSGKLGRADGGTAGVHKADTVDHLLHTQGSNEGLHLQVADHQ